MKTLKTLSASIGLTLVLAVAAFAGEMNSPPRVQPVPGEMNSPPCASAPLTSDDSVAPGQTSTPPSAGNAVSFAEVAVDVLQSVLMLF